jgi:transposase
VSGLGEIPTSGDLFVFTNQRRNLIKALLWDRTGYIIISKRLEKGSFKLRCSGSKVELTPQSLEMLLDGLPAGGVSLDRALN